jgi:5-hydroxyisourate hydrolase
MGVSTHILDTALGRPAAKVPVALIQWQSAGWVQLDEASTDADGRVKNLLPADTPLTPGLYRVHFDTAAYYESQGLEGLYPYVDIVFHVTAGQPHYHIPLLLTANGYTTYRGS